MAQIKVNMTYGATGTLPAVSGANLTTLNASNISSGTLASARYSAGGITQADMYRLTADLSSNVDPISSNLERVDDNSFEKIGAGMSLSSGVYTFPATGLYSVSVGMFSSPSSDNHGILTLTTLNNGTAWGAVAECWDGSASNSASGYTEIFFNVTDVSNCKVAFKSKSVTGGSIRGSTSTNMTWFRFLRLGDDQ